MTFKTRMKRKIRRNLKSAPKGGNGIYIQLSSKRGVKILRYEYESYEDLVKYHTPTSVCNEARTMKIARRLYPYIPKCYGVMMFKLNGFYNIGMFIQHLGNTRISDVMEDPYPTVSLIDEKIRSFGICHNDMHEHNVMYFKQKYWVIDFASVNITK